MLFQQYDRMKFEILRKKIII